MIFTVGYSSCYPKHRYDGIATRRPQKGKKEYDGLGTFNIYVKLGITKKTVWNVVANWCRHKQTEVNVSS